MQYSQGLGDVFLVANILVYWAGKFLAMAINVIFRGRSYFHPSLVGLSLVALLTVALYALTIYAISEGAVAITSENAFALGELHGRLKAQAIVPGAMIFLVVGIFSLLKKFLRKARANSPGGTVGPD